MTVTMSLEIESGIALGEISRCYLSLGLMFVLRVTVCQGILKFLIHILYFVNVMV